MRVCDAPWCRADVVWTIVLGDVIMPQWSKVQRVCVKHAIEIKRDIAAGDTCPSRVVTSHEAVQPDWDAL